MLDDSEVMAWYARQGSSERAQSDTPREAGGLMNWAASKAVGGFI